MCRHMDIAILTAQKTYNAVNRSFLILYVDCVSVYSRGKMIRFWSCICLEFKVSVMFRLAENQELVFFYSKFFFFMFLKVS